MPNGSLPSLASSSLSPLLCAQPGVDDDLGGFAAAPRKKAAPAGGDMSAYFASIESCKECLDAGYGWCPIRRRCGGFANKKCRGDDTDMKAA